ncbi:hypothetical protein [Herbaspirillum autotrophicum]|uniref:hypothetical protein n=1 Tax=Herbaspirillum autotrophicum TaxID=180195 RepID=UPI00067DBE9C|nr:hypothetical protein [Herbaspirillum autotrophicum]
MLNETMTYQYAEQIPEILHSEIPEYVKKSLGLALSGLFPEFASAFPKTIKIMDSLWSTPRLCAREYFAIGGSVWRVYLALSREDKNLFFPLNSATAIEDKDGFDFALRMLPRRWSTIYRWFDSFSITTDDSYAIQDRQNTLFRYSGRRDIEFFRQESGLKKAQVCDVMKSLDIRNPAAFCYWFWNDAGDALFLDEYKCDQKVYHVRSNNIEDITLLADPENVLDEYLAHIMMGGNPAEFDFRKV